MPFTDKFPTTYCLGSGAISILSKCDFSNNIFFVMNEAPFTEAKKVLDLIKEEEVWKEEQ